MSATLDDQVIVLRSRGTSYAAIARRLGFDRTAEASEAFNRAVRSKDVAERVELRHEEQGRLDALAERTRRRADLDADGVARRLSSIEQLRARLMTD